MLHKFYMFVKFVYGLQLNISQEKTWLDFLNSTGSTWYCTVKIDVVPDCYWSFFVGTSNKPETMDLTMIFSQDVLLLFFSCSAAKVVFPSFHASQVDCFFFFSCCRVNDDDSVIWSDRLILFSFFLQSQWWQRCSGVVIIMWSPTNAGACFGGTL